MIERAFAPRGVIAPIATTLTGGRAMAVARVTKLTASSPKSWQGSRRRAFSF